MIDEAIHPTDAILREAAQQSITDGGQVIVGYYMGQRVYLSIVNMDEHHAFAVTHLDWRQSARVAASLIVQTEVALMRDGWDGQQAVSDVWNEVHENVDKFIADMKS